MQQQQHNQANQHHRTLHELYYAATNLSPEPEIVPNRTIPNLFNSRYGFPSTMSSPLTDNLQGYHQQQQHQYPQFYNYDPSIDSISSQFMNMNMNMNHQIQIQEPNLYSSCMRYQPSLYSSNLSRPIRPSYQSSIIRPPIRNREFETPVLDFYSLSCKGGESSPGSDSSGLNTNLSNLPPLKGYKGKIYQMIGDTGGCHYLTKKLLEGDTQEIEMFFSETKDKIREIMITRDGSVLIQKFLDVCSQEHIGQILSSVFSDDGVLLSLCLDGNGTHAIQKLMEKSTKEQRNGLVISVLVRITRDLSTNIYGNHVLQKCLNFSEEESVKILDVVADHCVEIAKDKSGCCVMQLCVRLEHTFYRDQLVSQIISNALFLSDDPYGNYVVQYVMQLKMDGVNTAIHEKLQGNYKSLSFSKFGSNVVEHFIECSSPLEYAHIDSIICELVRDQSDFLALSHDPFGNYVIQVILEKAQGNTKHRLRELVQYCQSLLQSHPHGKRVLDFVRKGKRSKSYRSNNHRNYLNHFPEQLGPFSGDRLRM